MIIFHGRPSHMKQLYSVCRAKSKTWRAIPDGDHNNSVSEKDYFNYIFEFLKEKAFGDH